MANILVFSETQNGHAKRVTLEILGHLTGHTLEVAVVGELQAEGVKELATFGASTVHQVKSDLLKLYSPEGYALALKQVIDAGKYDFVFSGATSMGKDFFPRLATKCDAGLASDLTSLTVNGTELSAIKPLFAGKCLAKVEMTGPRPHFATIRPNALGLNGSPAAAAGTLKETAASLADLKSVVKEVIKGASEKLDLTEANIIVSGGRAMKNAENFKILNELADVLGATVGASRAAVDSGYAAPSMQVGQTGKTVSPTLYIACGISGAIQHLAGMRTSKFIVAVNTDPEAPIFSKADYGIVGDLFKVVPLMTEEFKKILGK